MTLRRNKKVRPPAIALGLAVLVLIVLGFFYNAWTASAYDSDLFVTS